MAIRKVYGSQNSPDTVKVMACLLEHDLDFEFVPINLESGENKERWFLAMSVPVYQDGDIKQFESRAIIRSMAHEHGKKMNKGQELIYYDAKEQAPVSNWVDVEDHKFEPPALELISELLVKPKNGLAPDEKVVCEAEAKLGEVLDVYEVRLTKLKYLAGDKYTIADLLHLPNLHALIRTKAKNLIASRPHVSAWCAEILARPAWTKVVEMLSN